jgi:ketosteroid isomerase-like protein
MKYARHFGLLFTTGLFLLVSGVFSSAYADDYSEVSQLVRSGKLPEALAKADQFLSTQPKDAQMRFLKGVIQRDSGKTSDAIATFTRLTEDYPELPEPYNNLAVLYASQGQFDRARTTLEMALRTNQSYSTAHENLSEVYSKLASQAYSKALQLDSTAAATSAQPKLALIRELSASNGGKAQRPGAPTPSLLPPQQTNTPPTMVAALSPNKQGQKPTQPAQPLPPSLPAPKPAITSPTTPKQQISPTVTTSAPAVAPAPVAVVPAKVPATTPATATASGVPAPAPVPVPAAAPASYASKEVEAMVKSWASAWSARDVRSYLAMYGKDFAPPGGMSRSAWEEERRQRISGKSTISVKLENVSITVNGAKATVKFRQDYKANGLAVSSKKVLELTKNGDRWHIAQEAVAK